jgi:hypothetical protein
MRTFEIQTFKDGKWKLDSVFDDRELALFEAKRVNEGTRHSGVKVVEEIWDEVTNETTIRTLFRGGAARNDMPAKPKAAAKRTKSGYRTGKRKEGAGKRKRKAKKSGFITPIITLVLIILVAVGALIGLQHLPVFTSVR